LHRRGEECPNPASREGILALSELSFPNILTEHEGTRGRGTQRNVVAEAMGGSWCGATSGALCHPPDGMGRQPTERSKGSAYNPELVEKLVLGSQIDDYLRVQTTATVLGVRCYACVRCMLRCFMHYYIFLVCFQYQVLQVF